jgi:hypothetical protein
MTPTQRLILELARDGRDLSTDCRNENDRGRRIISLLSCLDRGWLERPVPSDSVWDSRITAAGRRALERERDGRLELGE